MPEISRFFGIVIKMFFSDHAPPHFHAEYAEHEALVAIETLELVRGELPRRALALVLEWAAATATNCELTGTARDPASPLNQLRRLNEDE